MVYFDPGKIILLTEMWGYICNADGQRTSKTVNGTKHTYYYAGGKLLRETYGTTTLDFFYADGVPYAFKHNGTLYYYITNLQGDVMSIVDAQGAAVASYSYDPYGNVLTATGTLAEINPLRYRGYYFDTETTLYYLQSRYYDPELGRFINADAYASTGQGILGNNMFAYCNNNPILYDDPTGTFCVDWDLNPRPTVGEKFAEWFLNTDEDERDEDNELTPDAKAKRLCLLFWNNLEYSCGVGMGYELSRDLLDGFAFAFGMHGDVLCVRLEDGEFSYGADYSSGISITAFMHNFGYVESQYNKYYQDGTMETSKGLWGDETWTLFSKSFYFPIGGHIRFGFDAATFCQEWNDTFK